MEFHPVANLFPMMSADDAEMLCLDIGAFEQREPILLAPDDEDGGKLKIADGRNRYNACIAVGKEPKYRTWDGKGSLVSIVVSLNLKRRHLSESQRSIVAAKLTDINSVGRPTGKSANLRNLSQTAAAGLLNVSPRSVTSAAKVLKDGDAELVEMVESGQMSVSEGSEIAKLPKAKQKRLIKQGRSSGKNLIKKHIAKSLRSTDKGFMGCAHCNPDFKWTDGSVSAFAQKIVFRAGNSQDPAARKYGRFFDAVTEEIEEDNLAGDANERYQLILNAIDAGAVEDGDTGIRERSDLQRVTKIPWPEFNHTIALMIDLGMIEPIEQGGKTDVARGARKTLFRRAARSETAELRYEMDEDFDQADVYADSFSR